VHSIFTTKKMLCSLRPAVPPPRSRWNHGECIGHLASPHKTRFLLKTSPNGAESRNNALVLRMSMPGIYQVPDELIIVMPAMLESNGG
jgi:hypothetical protein